MRAAASLLFSLLLVTSCKASVDVNANTPKEADEKSQEEPEPPPAQEAIAPPPVKTAFYGVTHALSLTPEAAAKPMCRCMAAVIGIPNNPAFAWRGTAPTVGDDAFVLGISSEGTPCDTTIRDRGPSIAGVDQEGSDVIVTIEDARPGIPLARGAIIPKPQGDGFLVFRAIGRLPYDDALPGSPDQVCRIRIRSGG